MIIVSQNDIKEKNYKIMLLCSNFNLCFGIVLKIVFFICIFYAKS